MSVAPALYDSARAGADFGSLDESARAELASALAKVRSEGLTRPALSHSQFRYELWSKGRLLQASVLAAFFPRDARNRPYLDYFEAVAGQSAVEVAGSDDLRETISTISRGPYSPAPEGIIVALGFPGIVLDGYLRSVLFMRDAGPLDVLPAWVGQ